VQEICKLLLAVFCTTFDTVFAASQPPKIVEKKKRFGDFEADLIEGTKKGNAVLLTIVDRKTQYASYTSALHNTVPEHNDSLQKKQKIEIGIGYFLRGKGLDQLLSNG
jgi:IS30 family transposase